MLIKPLCSPFVRMIARDDDTPMMMKVCQLVAVAETRHASIRAPSPEKNQKKIREKLEALNFSGIPTN